MKKSDDINKAKEHIEELLKLGKEIQDATPYLININQNLDWYNSVYGNLEDKRESVISIIKGPINEISFFKYSDFNVSVASGFTGTILTATADTSTLIRESDPKYHFLIKDLNNINPVEKTIENISKQLQYIDSGLCNEFDDVKLCYSQWLADLKTNSDLAKDSRTFQEHFYGIINKLRIRKKDWGTKKIPSISWNKMVDAICKSGSINKASFLRQQKIGDEIWDSYTDIMKKKITIPKQEMGEIFKSFINHIYAIINLIDDKIIHQK